MKSTAALKFVVVVSILIVVGVRFERTLIALALSAAFLVALLLARNRD